MSKDMLLAFVTVYQDNIEEFYKGQFATLLRYFRGSLGPQVYGSADGKDLRLRMRNIEDQLAEGLITGEEACNGLIDAVDQTGKKIDPTWDDPRANA